MVEGLFTLGNGITFASFHIFGKYEFRMQQFTICVTYGIIKGQQRVINVILRSSAPNAFDFIPKIIRDIVSSETVVNRKIYLLKSLYYKSQLILV